MKRFLMVLLTAAALTGIQCGGDDSPTTSQIGSISGKVIEDSSGTGLSGATVTTNPPTSAATTGPNGNYLIQNVPSGSYTVTAGKTGYQSASVSVSVSPGTGASADIVISYNYTTGTITGTIVEDSSGATVSGVNITTSPATNAATTDQSGSFTLSNVTPGSYKVEASKYGYRFTTADVMVNAGRITTVNITLSKSNLGVLQGRVESWLTGQNLAGITISTDPVTKTVVTDQNGEFEIDGVSPGVYKVITLSSQYQPDTASATIIDPSQPATVELQVKYNIPLNGLIASYTFDGGGASDGSGNNNNGSVNGAGQFPDRFGNDNRALDFDGTNDYVYIATPLISNQPSPFTINCWIKSDSAGYFGTLLADRAGTSNAYKYRILWNDDNKIRFYMYDGTTPSQIKSLTTLQQGVWYFVSAVYDNATANMYLYINGTLEANINSSIWSANLNPTTIGVIQGPVTEQWFNGAIDDLRIYNRALSVQEIQTLYNEL